MRLCCKEASCILRAAGGRVEGLALPQRVFPCATPAQVRATLPEGADVLAFQCRNPIHRAHYELFTRALDAPNVRPGAVCLVHPTCGPTQVRPNTLTPVLLSSAKRTPLFYEGLPSLL